MYQYCSTVNVCDSNPHCHYIGAHCYQYVRYHSCHSHVPVLQYSYCTNSNPRFHSPINIHNGPFPYRKCFCSLQLFLQLCKMWGNDVTESWSPQLQLCVESFQLLASLSNELHWRCLAQTVPSSHARYNCFLCDQTQTPSVSVHCSQPPVSHTAQFRNSYTQTYIWCLMFVWQSISDTIVYTTNQMQQ